VLDAIVELAAPRADVDHLVPPKRHHLAEVPNLLSERADVDEVLVARVNGLSMWKT
jgi:hypothetical protein